MNSIANGWFVIFVVSAALSGGDPNRPKPVRDVEVSGIIVDGLDRPVPGATVTFFYYERPSDEPKQVTLATFTTDDSGRYGGVVHDWPESEWMYKSVNKSGFRPCAEHMATLDRLAPSRLKNDRFTIWCEMPYEDAVEGLSRLKGDALDQHVLEVLASELWRLGALGSDTPYIEDVFFAHQDRLLTALHEACANPHVGDRARRFLEFVGRLNDPCELQLIEVSWRSTPKVQVSARRLNDAVQAVVEAYHLIGEGEGVPIEGEMIIDRTVFTGNSNMALIRCHTHYGCVPGQGYKLRFEKVGREWVLKAMVLDWIT